MTDRKNLPWQLEELRDKLAMTALNGCLSHSDTSNVVFNSVEEDTDYYAKLAYAYADAMLKARG
ncbi:hypothetical protein [Providencia rettgeri]|uniref:hypothetical protein n=1 Tax=Providencia rettgeri TaxID=587 RepID=UPI0030101492